MKNISKLLLVACFAMNVGYVQGSMPGQYTPGMPYIPLSAMPTTADAAVTTYNMLLAGYYSAQGANDMVALAQIATDLTTIKIFLASSTPETPTTPAPVNYAPVDQPVAPTPVMLPAPVVTPVTTGSMYFTNKTPNKTVTLTFSDGRSSYTMYPLMKVQAISTSTSILNSNSSLRVTATDASGTYKKSSSTWVQKKTDNVAGVRKYVTVTTDGNKLVVTVS